MSCISLHHIRYYRQLSMCIPLVPTCKVFSATPCLHAIWNQCTGITLLHCDPGLHYITCKSPSWQVPQAAMSGGWVSPWFQLTLHSLQHQAHMGLGTTEQTDICHACWLQFTWTTGIWVKLVCIPLVPACLALCSTPGLWWAILSFCAGTVLPHTLCLSSQYVTDCSRYWIGIWVRLVCMLVCIPLVPACLALHSTPGLKWGIQSYCPTTGIVLPHKLCLGSQYMSLTAADTEKVSGLG